MDNRNIGSPCYEAVEKFLTRISREEYKEEMFSELDRMDLWNFAHFPEYGPILPIYRDYLLETVVEHKIAVYDAGMNLMDLTTEERKQKDGTPYKVSIAPGFTERLLIFHDMSKFSYQESSYAEYFYYSKQEGETVPPNIKKQFKIAWHHHKINNPHHPEHWHVVERDGQVSSTIPMPPMYAFEMVADWVGASKVYGTPLEEWTTKNLGQFKLHPDTLSDIIKPLARFGVYINTHALLHRPCSLSASEAVYGFAGWLTTRGEVTTMSASHDSGVVAELVNQYCELNRLTPPRDWWEENLIHEQPNLLKT